MSAIPCYHLYHRPERGYFGIGQASFSSAQLHFLNYSPIPDKVLSQTKTLEISASSAKKRKQKQKIIGDCTERVVVSPR